MTLPYAGEPTLGSNEVLIEDSHAGASFFRAVIGLFSVHEGMPILIEHTHERGSWAHASRYYESSERSGIPRER